MYMMTAYGDLDDAQVYGRAWDFGETAKGGSFAIDVGGYHFFTQESPQVSNAQGFWHFDWLGGNVGFVIGPFQNGHWHCEVHIRDANIHRMGALLNGNASVWAF